MTNNYENAARINRNLGGVDPRTIDVEAILKAEDKAKEEKLEEKVDSQSQPAQQEPYAPVDFSKLDPNYKKKRDDLEKYFTNPEVEGERRFIEIIQKKAKARRGRLSRKDIGDILLEHRLSEPAYLERHLNEILQRQFKMSLYDFQPFKFEEVTDRVGNVKYRFVKEDLGIYIIKK
ncbi:hypothetical protein HZA33_00685 [Candidatus Pacearchaeota archaeon]|nr:hypothetical protein [Candidatus Pacearchaeota archaeon]